MIKTIRKNNSVYLSFFPETTICTVQEDMEKLGGIFSSLDGIDNMYVNLKHIDYLDTAYLQLIYSLLLTGQKEYINISILKSSKVFDEFIGLYGLSILIKS
jgi:ABC-type transporter Mla MlaB component